MRICTKCGIAKPKEGFYKESRVLDGCKASCKKCDTANGVIKQRERREAEKIANPKPVKEKAVRKPPTEKERESNKIRLAKKRECPIFREEQKQYKAVWHKENKVRLNEVSKIYNENHKEERKEYLDSYKPRRRELTKQKREKDPLYRFKENLRSGVNRAFKIKGWGKTGKSHEILGCDLNTAKAHIERQFKKGMTWDNYGTGEGKWVIDHKIPLSSAKNEEESRHLCHYRNLQPLWEKENLIKNSKIIPTQIHLSL